jgi:hypothetical protein
MPRVVTGVSRLCRNYCAVPPGLDFVPLLPPGPDVPGFPVSPLRGWRNSAVHFFVALGVATQTRLARPSRAQSSAAMDRAVIPCELSRAVRVIAELLHSTNCLGRRVMVYS